MTPLFLGLTRPARVMGVPAAYFVMLVMATVIPFIAFNSLKYLLTGPVLYGPAWVLAERNPNFFEMFVVVMHRTPRTWRRRINGGDRYVG